MLRSPGHAARLISFCLNRLLPSSQERLRLVREIRDFASHELHLPENGSYRSYADIKRTRRRL